MGVSKHRRKARATFGALEKRFAGKVEHVRLLSMVGIDVSATPFALEAENDDAAGRNSEFRR